MILPFAIGMYAGIGLCAGLWYYFDPGPSFMDDPGRVIKSIQALIVAVGWLPLFVSVIIEIET